MKRKCVFYFMEKNIRMFWSNRISFYIPDMSPLSDRHFTNIFSQKVSCLFTFFFFLEKIDVLNIYANILNWQVYENIITYSSPSHLIFLKRTFSYKAKMDDYKFSKLSFLSCVTWNNLFFRVYINSHK